MKPPILKYGDGGLEARFTPKYPDEKEANKMTRRLLFVATAMTLLPSGAAAQSTKTSALAAGRFLVATRELADPSFAKTVVLLVHYDEDGVLGLIVNRRTKVPIERAFPELPESAKGRSEMLYAGGPVQRTAAMALVRSRAKPDGAERVFADVSMVSGKAPLEKMIGAGTEPDTFHLYAGYAGWTVEQLEKEVELGGWTIFPADASMVFDPDPESLWPRLIKPTEQLVAADHSPGGSVSKMFMSTSTISLVPAPDGCSRKGSKSAVGSQASFTYQGRPGVNGIPNHGAEGRSNQYVAQEMKTQ